jgi:hypothetical protein
MLDRYHWVLKWICIGLAALVVYQLARLAAWRNPLANLSVPTTASRTDGPETQTAGTGTNSVARPESKGTNLPPAVQARIDRVTQSEVLAPIVRPLPMALLGIAGGDAFLRAPNGQIGLVREGAELGGVKLLRIGINRVLIEHEGQKKELTLFSGFGGEPLKAKEEPQ